VIPSDLIFITHCLATLAMCGIVWFVQIVHYPLMHHVDQEDTYFIHNSRRTRRIVMPLMLLEFTTGFLLILRDVRPDYLPMGVAGVGMLLLAGSWFITFHYQIPRHQILIQTRYNGQIVRELVRFNWIRTLLWTIRSSICGWVLLQALP